MHRLASGLLSVLLACGAIPAHAAVTCVSTPAQFAAALTAAGNNGQPDDIRLQRGTYKATQAVQFDYYGADPSPADLAVSGDWNSNCTQQGNDPFSTIIDGSHVSRGLSITTNSPGAGASVRLLTFRNGVAGNSGGGGLYIRMSGSDLSFIRVESNAFLENAAGALNATGGNFQQIINNMFLANTAPYWSAVSMRCGLVGEHPGFGAFTNNTIVYNEATEPPNQTTGAVYISCGAGAIVANNNFDGNSGAHDLYIYRYPDDSGTYTLRNNNIHGPTSADVESGNIDVVPEYEGGIFDVLNFTPVRSSPLVDAGIGLGGALAFWYLTDFDMYGSPRKIGPHVDIGAYENERIFTDGFDPSGPFGRPFAGEAE